MNVDEWFGEWLRFHKSINPHQRFKEYETSGFDEVYAGWIMAFEKKGIDRLAANLASRLMQAEDKREIFPEHHLARLIELAAKGTQMTRMDADDIARRSRIIAQRKEDQRQDRIKAAWETLDRADRETHREVIRSENPTMARFEAYVELMARNRWAEAVRAAERAKVAV